MHHDNSPVTQHTLGLHEHIRQEAAAPALVDVSPLVVHAVNPRVTWVGKIDEDSQTP